MIDTLEITNFKSVKHLTLPCQRFNVFIGEPNTGKSNILEALGLMSFIGVKGSAPDTELAGFVRHERTSNLFYDEEIGESLNIRCDDLVLRLDYQDGRFDGPVVFLRHSPGTGSHAIIIANIVGEHRTINEVSHMGDYWTMFNNPASISSHDNTSAEVVNPGPIQFYRFQAGEPFQNTHGHHLLPPFGTNLPSLLMQNRELRNAVNLPFLSQGLRLGLRPQENKIELIKSSDDIIISSPYSLVSETWQRLTFYTAAMLTNRDSVLVFEEPEAHSFPHYTNHLAERIALDENNNQYFIATHNPYFLMSLLEKSEKGQLAINIVYSEDYQTKVKEIPPSELPELFELDVFANLDRYLQP